MCVKGRGSFRPKAGTMYVRLWPVVGLLVCACGHIYFFGLQLTAFFGKVNLISATLLFLFYISPLVYPPYLFISHVCIIDGIRG